MENTSRPHSLIPSPLSQPQVTLSPFREWQEVGVHVWQFRSAAPVPHPFLPPLLPSDSFPRLRRGSSAGCTSFGNYMFQCVSSRGCSPFGGGTPSCSSGVSVLSFPLLLVFCPFLNTFPRSTTRLAEGLSHAPWWGHLELVVFGMGEPRASSHGDHRCSPPLSKPTACYGIPSGNTQSR